MRYRVRGPLRGHQRRRIRDAGPPLPQQEGYAPTHRDQQQPAARPQRPALPRPQRPPLPRPSAAANRAAPQPVLEWAALRRVRPLPLAALMLRWLLIAVLCLAVLDVARVAGVPIVLLVLVWSWSAVVQRRRRPRPPYRPTPPADRRPSPGAPPHPASPPRGNPYDLETYLRRLREDRR